MKTKIAVLSLVAFSLLAIAGVQAAAPTPKQVLDNMAKAYSKLKSFEASGTMVNTVTIDGKKQSSTIKYKFAFQRPAKLRLEAEDGKEKRLVVCDGNNVFALLPGGKQYQKTSLNGDTKRLAGLGGSGVNPVALLVGVDFSKAITKPKIVAQKPVFGTDAYVVQYPLDKNGQVIQKLWISKRDWLIRKSETVATQTVDKKEKAGTRKVKVSQTSVTNISSLKANAPVTASAFVYKPPKGVTLFDPEKAAAEQKKKVESVGNALEGKQAPAISLKTVKGKSVSLASMKGKVVVVTFWFSKLPTSKTDMARLQKFYNANKSKGLEVLAVSVDEKQSDAKSFADKQKLTFTVATGETKSLQSLAASYRLVAIPTTYIVDRSGKIVEHFVGDISEAVLQAAVKKAGL